MPKSLYTIELMEVKTLPCKLNSLSRRLVFKSLDKTIYICFLYLIRNSVCLSGWIVKWSESYCKGRRSISLFVFVTNSLSKSYTWVWHSINPCVILIGFTVLKDWKNTNEVLNISPFTFNENKTEEGEYYYQHPQSWTGFTSIQDLVK